MIFPLHIFIVSFQRANSNIAPEQLLPQSFIYINGSPHYLNVKSHKSVKFSHYGNTLYMYVLYLIIVSVKFTCLMPTDILSNINNVI